MNNSNLEFRKIKSLKFLYEINENGTILRNVKSKKHIKIKLDKHHSKAGYYAAWICRDKKVQRLTIHKLVAECWLGDKPDGMEIDHIDRNTHNNHYSNLRYVSHSEQMKNRVLSEHVIEQAKANCRAYVEYISKPVMVRGRGEEITFPSMSECSRYMSEVYGMNAEGIRHKLRKKRSHIFDYDIYFLNAETGHAGSTEQGTVRDNTYLVGTLDRFNNAKRAEVGDRVKHGI